MRKFLFIVVYCLFTSLQAQKLTSGGVLKPEQAVMDIRHYSITLDVDVANQSISGSTTINLLLLQPTRTLWFDLLNTFAIKSVTVNGKNQPFVYENNLIKINLANELPKGKVSVAIAYDGKPHIAVRPPWDDGFTWSKDSNGQPWVAITAEGTGGKIFYPCKDHPSDEPNEGADLIITVPKGLVVAGPGLLIKTTTKGDKVTYRWKTNYTTNNYSILFNVGKYEVVSREYVTSAGHTVPMKFYVLPEHASQAPHLLEMMEQSARVREKYFGEYPWVKEKIGLVETPHLGMEHQTMNAYGNKFRYEKVGDKDYDGLMDHEFGHEWWGNKITVKDWADFWIHEGINTFGDALYIQDMAGKEAYIDHFKRSALYFENKTALVQGKDIDEESAYIGDIYGKGAFFMHTLRFVLGDSIFFPALKQFATDPAFTYDNLVSTGDIEQFFSKKSGIDLQPLFNLYLRSPDKLEIEVKRIKVDAYQVRTQNLDMSIPLRIMTSNGPLTVNVDKKGKTINSATLPVIDPDMFYLTRVIIE